MTVRSARILAHLYCLFHWSWKVYWNGNPDDPGHPTRIFTMKNNKIMVSTYPEWWIYIWDKE